MPNSQKSENEAQIESAKKVTLSPASGALEDYNNAAARLRIKDYTQKLDSRRNMKWILITLLLLQNGVVFYLVTWSLWNEKLIDLQTVLAVIISATLGETYLMVKIMVEWLFKDIDYK